MVGADYKQSQGDYIIFLTHSLDDMIAVGVDCLKKEKLLRKDLLKKSKLKN